MSENIQVPKGWEVKKLGEVFDIQMCKRIYKEQTNYESGIPFYKIGTIGKIADAFIDEQLFDTYRSKYNYPLTGETLITCSGTIGKCYQYNGEKAYFQDSNIVWLRAKNQIKIDLNYIFIIVSNIKWNSVEKTTITRLYTPTLKKASILLPPLEEQKKIAEILSLWDKAIEQTKDLIAYKEKQKKGLMQALLTGKKRLNGFTDEWKTTKLGECFKNFGGAPLEKYMNIASKYKFISIGNYSTQGKYIDNGNRIILNDITQTKLLNKNDLVMVLNDKTADGKIIGATILIDEDNTYIYNQRSERLVCNKNVFPLFFWLLLNSELIRKEIFAMAQGGTQIYINFSSIKSINIFLPPLDEQKAIAEILSSADEEIELLNKQLELYTEQKKGLMQNLLTGKVRV